MAILAGLQSNLSPRRTFLAGSSALPAFRLLVMTSGVINLAAATAVHFFGSTEETGAAASTPVNVLLRNAPGSRIIEAGAAITAGVDVMPDDNGRIITATTGSKYVFGKAITGAGAAGDLVEFIPLGANYQTGA